MEKARVQEVECTTETGLSINEGEVKKTEQVRYLEGDETSHPSMAFVRSGRGTMWNISSDLQVM